MKPIDMKTIGVVGEGDCLMACAASILEITLDELPAITPDNEPVWFNIFQQAMADRGFYVNELHGDFEPDASGKRVRPALAPLGHAIAIGPCPRSQSKENHAVVALDGAVVHDPHPTRTGILRVDYWLTLVPLLRSTRQLAPQLIEIDADVAEAAL